MDPVAHFEMPYEDKKRMADFYRKAFGWKTEELGPEMGNYVIATTSETDENKTPVRRGNINGGFFEKSEMGRHPNVVVVVKDIADSIKKINEAGGKVLGEPMEIPGIGRYVSFRDTEGNRNAVMQPFREMK